MTRTLSRDRAKAFYDAFGAKQDAQAFYEEKALRELIAHSDFPHAASVFEFGCGTGKLAERLLEHHMRIGATYAGVDLSSTMVTLARTRLARFGERARIEQTDGSDPWRGVVHPVERVVTTYVLDLLPDDEIDAFLSSAMNALVPGGRLSVASLTNGTTIASRVVMSGWRGLFRLSPRIVGGCRPVRMAERLAPRDWNIMHRSTLSAWGIASEVVVAGRR
jgi:cyclopropane fatty-acyl-phospholipid synthase-like methyltransferase